MQSNLRVRPILEPAITITQPVMVHSAHTKMIKSQQNLEIVSTNQNRANAWFDCQLARQKE